MWSFSAMWMRRFGLTERHRPVPGRTALAHDSVGEGPGCRHGGAVGKVQASRPVPRPVPVRSYELRLSRLSGSSRSDQEQSHFCRRYFVAGFQSRLRLGNLFGCHFLPRRRQFRRASPPGGVGQARGRIVNHVR